MLEIVVLSTKNNNSIDIQSKFSGKILHDNHCQIIQRDLLPCLNLVRLSYIITKHVGLQFFHQTHGILQSFIVHFIIARRRLCSQT